MTVSAEELKRGYWPGTKENPVSLLITSCMLRAEHARRIEQEASEQTRWRRYDQKNNALNKYGLQDLEKNLMTY
jgi:hypothetical protein